MANFRQIHVSIWKDEWFLDLEPAEKLLFIYLFSNESTSISGLYKLPLKVIQFETGLDKQFILDTLSKFSDANKIHYEDGIVWVVKMRYYHETRSAKVQIRIEKDIESIPDCPLKIRYLYGMDTTPQLKEYEEEDYKNKKTNGATSYSEAVRVFGNVTGMLTIPGREDDRAYAIDTIIQLSRAHTDLEEYLEPYYKDWLSRGYKKTNIHWLDWAIAGEAPQTKQTTDPRNVPTEEY